MSLKTVTSRDNPEYRRLHALAEDARARKGAGEALLDGEHLLEEALLAGIHPRQLILCAGISRPIWLERLPDVPALELPESLFRKLSPVATPTGLLAVIPLPAPPHSVGDFVLLLDTVQDPGNMGAILRCAAATGVTDVLLSRGCAEAWSPKALRGGQGGHFRLRIHESVDLDTWLDDWPGAVHAAAPGAQHSLYDLRLSGPIAFMFGNEGLGISSGLLTRCQTFSIPMAGGVESLNVAAAVAVCLYERVRQGLAKCEP